MDPALRRAGRFDREIEIGIPSEEKRLDILQKMMYKIPNQLTPEEFKRISAVTHGYVGADLKGLVRESALNALTRWQATQDLSRQQTLQHEELNQLAVTLPDFQRALTKMVPSAMRAVKVEVPKVRWTDIGGQAEIKQKLREAVEWPLLHPEAFLRLGIQPPKGILLYGPPGCSKTLMAKALASESSRNFIAVKGPELFSKWVGESEKGVSEVFRRARAAAPSIIFFDEVDSLAPARSDNGSQTDRVAHRVLSQLLVEMDGISSLKQVTILCATNRPDLIDRALLRPGRIDRILYVAPPDLEACREILKIELRRMAHSADVDVDVLARQCVGLSGAEMSALAREAALVAMEEDVNIKEVSMRHFEAAISRTTPRITPAMLKFYKDYAENCGVASI